VDGSSRWPKLTAFEDRRFEADRARNLRNGRARLGKRVNRPRDHESGVEVTSDVESEVRDYPVAHSPSPRVEGQ
jgi:hypothetical protein